MKNIIFTIILIISSVKANAQFLISAGAAGQEYSVSRPKIRTG